jgi:hypothetical protein
MAKKRASKRGGARKGAGRKLEHPEGPTVPITASVPEQLIKRLDGLAKTKGWNRSRAVTEAIRGLLDRQELT